MFIKKKQKRKSKMKKIEQITFTCSTCLYYFKSSDRTREGSNSKRKCSVIDKYVSPFDGSCETHLLSEFIFCNEDECFLKVEACRNRFLTKGCKKCSVGKEINKRLGDREDGIIVTMG